MPGKTFERDPDVAARLAKARETLSIPRRCPKGHNLSDKNIYIRPKGDRWDCRICTDEHRKASLERKKTAKLKPAPQRLNKSNYPIGRPLKGPGSARDIIAHALNNLGGEASDPSAGRAATILHEEAQRLGYTGQQGGMNGLLRGMESDGLIYREINGKRTYRIVLLDDGVSDAEINVPAKQVNVPATRPITPEEVETISNLLGTDKPEVEEPETDDEDEGEMLALLIENIDHVAFIERVADELRRPRGVTYAEHSNQVAQLHETYGNKIKALETELKDLRFIKAEALRFQADFVKLKQEHENLERTSNELLDEATKQISDLQAQVVELKKKVPGSKADPDLAAKKAAAMAKVAKRFQT